MDDAFKTWADYITAKNINKALENNYSERYQKDDYWLAYKDHVVEMLLPTKSKLLLQS